MPTFHGRTRAHTRAEGSVNLNVNCVTAFTTRQSQVDSADSFPGGQRKTEMKKSVKRSSLTEPCQSAAVPTLIIDWMIRADEEIFF